MNGTLEVTEKQGLPVDAPLTIEQFCERYSISRYSYYRMRKRGETPAETVISPRRRVILPASLREWEQRRLAADNKAPLLGSF